MASRLFPRHPKKAQEEAPPFESEAGSQLISNDLALGHALAGDKGPDQTIVPLIPAVSPQDQREPGWYPDTTDPGLMRYWDGFHFTGQAKRANSPALSTDEVQEEVQSAVALANDVPSVHSDPQITGLDAPAPTQLAPTIGEPSAPEGRDETVGAPSPISTWLLPAPNPPLGMDATSGGPDHARSVEPSINPGFTIGMAGDVPGSVVPGSVVPGSVETAPVETVEGDTAETLVAAITDNDHVSDRDRHSSKENLMDSSNGQGAADGVNNWGKDAELAVAKALTVDTPEAWQEAASVAVVVSEMAQTMQSVADAKQTARQTSKTAEEAAEEARVAAKTAADAKDTADRMTKAAEDAAEAARVAAQTAVEAKGAAERTAQAAPKVAETAAVASKTASDAQHKAEALEQVVARARAANTPAAWSEAREIAALAVEAKPSGDQAVTEPRPGDTSPPALWKRSTPVVGSVADSLDQVRGVREPLETKSHQSQDVDVLAELGPATKLSPAPDGRST